MASGGPPVVVTLASLEAQHIALGGGKAANLSKLLRWGFPVPAAFVVTTAAYDAVAIVTAHSDVDYAQLVEQAQLVVDFRNATGRNGARNEKVWTL